MFWIGPAIQGVMGLAQGIKGLTMENPDLPEYEKSKELQGFLNLAKNELGGISAEAKEGFSQTRQAGAEAYGMAERASSSGGQALRAAMATGAQVGKGIAGVALQEAANRNQRMSNLSNAVQMETRENFLVNQREMAIAEEARARRDAMIGSAIQNVGGAASSIGNMMFAKDQNAKLMEMLKSSGEKIPGGGGNGNKVVETIANIGAGAATAIGAGAGAGKTVGAGAGAGKTVGAGAGAGAEAFPSFVTSNQIATLPTPQLPTIQPAMVPHRQGMPSVTTPYATNPSIVAAQQGPAANTANPGRMDEIAGFMQGQGLSTMQPSIAAPSASGALTATTNVPPQQGGSEQFGMDALLKIIEAQGLMDNPAFQKALLGTKNLFR